MDSEYKRIWNKICDKMDEHKTFSEDKLQVFVEDAVFDMQLGWDKSEGRIKRDPIHFGSSSYGIPDLLLCKDNKKLLCVELKKYLIGIKEKNKDQLFSYMRQLKLYFGILWGSSIQLYYDEISDNQPPICVFEIPFKRDNDLGIKLMELLYYANFNYENFKSFCLDVIKENKSKNEIKEKIEFLCSSNGLEYIKDLLLIEYSSEVVDKLNIVVKAQNNVITSNLYKKISFTTQKTDVNLDENLSRKGNETIQDWIKRVLVYFNINEKLTDEELEMLQNKEYSQINFGIQYPLLTDNYEKCFEMGHSRYWLKWPSSNRRFMDKYYVCSQWWKQYDSLYEKNINNWINKIMQK